VSPRFSSAGGSWVLTSQTTRTWLRSRDWKRRRNEASIHAEVSRGDLVTLGKLEWFGAEERMDKPMRYRLPKKTKAVRL